MLVEYPQSELNFHEFKYHTDQEIHIRIQHKYSKTFDVNLIFTGLCSIILPLYNVFIIYQNFFVYYNSFSDVYRPLVTYFEFIAINFLLFFGLVKAKQSWGNSVGRRLFFLNRFLSGLQFNLFSFVYYLSYKDILSIFSNARHRAELESEDLIKQNNKEEINTVYWKLLKGLTTVACLILYVGLLLLIIFSVLTKLSVVSFIGDISINQWSYHQMSLFFGIVNNLSSLAQRDEVTLHFMWTILNAEWDVEKSEWKRENLYSFRMCRFYEMMYEVSRWKTLLWIRTMNGRELHDLVRQP